MDALSRPDRSFLTRKKKYDTVLGARSTSLEEKDHTVEWKQLIAKEILNLISIMDN